MVTEHHLPIKSYQATVSQIRLNESKGEIIMRIRKVKQAKSQSVFITWRLNNGPLLLSDLDFEVNELRLWVYKFKFRSLTNQEAP